MAFRVIAHELSQTRRELDVLESVLIATTNAAAGGAEAMTVTSVWDFLMKGGLMMIPLGVCSFIVLAVTIERLILLRRSRIVPRELERELGRVLESDGANVKRDALKVCRKSNSPMGRILESGVHQFGRPVEFVEKHVAAAAEHEVFELRKRLRVLSVITAAAPLIGLVGTIFGMIRAFQTVAMSGDALGKTELLAGGIYEAMISTAAGLIVAIPSLMLYHWIAGKIDRIVREMDRMGVVMSEAIAIAGRRGGLALVRAAEEVDDDPSKAEAVS